MNIDITDKELDLILAAIVFQSEQINAAIKDDPNVSETLRLSKELTSTLEDKFSKNDFNFTMQESQAIYSMLVLFRRFCNDTLKTDLPTDMHNETLEYSKSANRLIQKYKSIFAEIGMNAEDFFTMHDDTTAGLS